MELLLYTGARGVLAATGRPSMPRPTGTGGKAQELSRDEIRRVDKCLTGTRHELRNRALLYLGLGTGMRVDELVRLQVQDVTPHPPTILSRIVLEKHRTKSKRARAVELSDQGRKHLQVYLETRLLTPQAAVFPSQINPTRPLTTNNAIKLLKRMFVGAGVANASSHSLRRTHANTLRRRGVDLLLIKEQLGHASLATTQRYFDVDPVEAAAAVGPLKF